MVLSLITPAEEKYVLDRLIEYYKKLYSEVQFKKEEKALSKKEIADLSYTYPGEEEQATSLERMSQISEEIKKGYSTPIIVLKKKNKKILVDGHRRARFAFEDKSGWKAFLIVPQKEITFGLEKMVLGKVNSLFKKKK